MITLDAAVLGGAPFDAATAVEFPIYPPGPLTLIGALVLLGWPNDDPAPYRFQVWHAASDTWFDALVATSEWVLVFSDDFSQNVSTGSFPAAVSGKWGAYLDGWTDTSGRGTYSPSQVISVHDGTLDMHIRTVAGVHQVSAIYPLIPNGLGSAGISLNQGRYVIRFRADSMPGYKLANLLWPDSGLNLRDGEIDFPEGDFDDLIYGYVHHTNATSGGDQDWYPTGLPWTAWHTAVTERASGFVSFYLDGVLIGRSTDRLPVGPMEWVIQAETSIVAPTIPSGTDGHFYIDSVEVWVPSLA